MDNNFPESAIAQAARVLVERYGDGAVVEAAERAAAHAREGRWPEHDIALRLLTAIEQLVRRP